VAYLRPPAFTRKVFNPLALTFGIGGTVPLVVRKRRTGGEQRVPVIPVEVAGARYICTPRGETDWVRNLRAAGGEATLGGEQVRATEIPAGERAPILAAYRDKAGKSVASYFKRLPDPADHPTFRVDEA
jgi:hypothetical protein